MTITGRNKLFSNKARGGIIAMVCLLVISWTSCQNSNAAKASPPKAPAGTGKKADTATAVAAPKAAVLDTLKYNALLHHLMHDSTNAKWPVKTCYPVPGALLPYKRIVAYYGNFYTAKMGVLGDVPEDSMLKHLLAEAAQWQKADTTMQVVPALHYIAVTAQTNPGKDKKYRARMPAAQIDKAIELAKKINGIVFLDIQVGWSNVGDEVPLLEKYLSMPNVHLGIDPEFSMKGGQVPCKAIGTFDAADINTASEYLAKIVRKYNLPPKVLIVHRFTQGMVTNYKNIITRPEVQIIVDMDGFGGMAKKKDSYKIAVVREPVQFAGFKLFYKNDKMGPEKRMMTTSEVLGLYPSPVYIQYQ